MLPLTAPSYSKAQRHAKEQAKKSKEEAHVSSRDRAKVDRIRNLSQELLAGEENLQLLEQRCIVLVDERDDAQSQAETALAFSKRQAAAIARLKAPAANAGADSAEIAAAATVE